MDTLNRFTLHSFIKVLSVLTMTYFSLSAYSSVQEPSGVITFTGNIVNAPCLVSQDKPSDLRFGCLDEHANMKTEYVDLNKLAYTTKASILSNHLGSYEFEWLRNDHKEGLVKIRYQ